MKHQGGFNFLVLFLLLLCVLVNSSVGYKFCHTRRFVQEQEKINGSVVCADITGSKWKMKKPMENSCKTLEVWVPKKVGFTEFVNVNEHNEVEGGFSIAIFCYVLETLPFSIVPNFIPFVNATGHMNGTYDQLLKQIENQTCAAVAGDVTIRGNRAQYVSFTAPYLSAEVYMIVDATRAWNQTLWTFLRPFTNRVWITLVSACILIGITIAILEYRAENPNFTSPFYRQLIMVMWFPISTIFFNEGKIRNKGSKVILVVWLCMFPIVGQIYTASLSSWLTLNQLRPNLPSSFCDVGIGYPAGSFINDLIIKQYNCSSGNKLRELNGYEEYRKALSDGTVIAVIDELPYVNLFLSMYGSDYMKHGPINQASGIAFILIRKVMEMQWWFAVTGRRWWFTMVSGRRWWFTVVS
uniref:glutamate receptor 3.1-like isoform X2 n=1 Tax=Erigeron canadensis TaxID=72917 RepID=UPI001CB99637|nr:glutamate receptor 3.1-like isoform X2 [Erigeron canadensis]